MYDEKLETLLTQLRGRDLSVKRKLRKLKRGSTMYLVISSNEEYAGHIDAMSAVALCKQFYPRSMMTSGGFGRGFNITVVLKP
jgi:hypothetical protein